MQSNQAAFPIRTMANVRGVSASGFYAWLDRPLCKRVQSNVALQERIEAIHTKSDQTYGVPRIVAELRDTHQWIVNHKRCARLMRINGIRGVSKRRGYCAPP